MTFDKQEVLSRSRNDEFIPLHWIRILGISVLAISLLFVLLLNSSFAQDEPQDLPDDPPAGFEPGTRDFSNPFNPSAPPGAAPSRVTPPTRAQRSTPGGRIIKFPSKTTDPDDVPAPTRNEEGLAVGGEPPGGVIAEKKALPTIDVDDFGYGSKEVVTDFNFPDAEVVAVAKTLGKLTGKNFILDKNVKGRITIISNSPITVGDAWKAFLTALDIAGFALIPSGKYIRIARQRDARDKQLKTYIGNNSPDSDALITRVFPLKHIDADEVARTLRSFMPANSRIIPYQQTNTVIVTDTGSNIQKLATLLDVLDVEGYDAGIEVISVKHASAVELAKLIDTLLPGTSTSAPGRPRTTGNFASRRTKEGGVINTIIADERTNSLIVHANLRGAEQVRKLVNKLDRHMPLTTGGGRIHVVYLQFASAEEVATTLNSLGSGGGGAPPRITRPGGGTGSNPVTGSLFEGAIKVSADKATNSLVITASPSDFVVIQRVLAKLDIPRDEVYVEAIIMEMIISKESHFSSNLALPTSGVSLMPNGDLLSFLQNPLSQKGLAFGFKEGKTTEIEIDSKKFKVNSVMGLINAIQVAAKANVLATPQLLTLDNTKALFETNEKIPVPTTVSTATSTQQSLSSENVKLSIEITPHINKETNFVKLEILINLADISKKEPPANVKDLAFIIFDRKINTTVVVADGDTVVLGGLIRDKETESVSKIPILGDIPLLGWLFRARDGGIEKSNLLVFLTPHIIRQYEKVRALLDKKLKQRDDFLEKNAGGDDPHRDYRDEMIRTLPKMEDLVGGSSKSASTTNAVNPGGSTLGTQDSGDSDLDNQDFGEDGPDSDDDEDFE